MYPLLKMFLQKIINFILIFTIIFYLPLFVVVKPILAETFMPALSITSSDITPNSNPDITLTTVQPEGDEVLSQILFSIPAGWDFVAGSSLPQDAEIAYGTFTAFVVEVNNTMTVPVTIRNDKDLQDYKAHWKILFGNPSSPYVTLDSFLDGDISKGHTFTISRAYNFTLQSPVIFSLTFNGIISGIPALTSPLIQGNYNWTAKYTSPTNVEITRIKTLTIPGTATPTGANVTASFSGGSSITFSSVTTDGVTTQTTLTTPPSEGTGQFQLSGGLYFDFNSSAKFSCPCTVTLPYDPVETPNPRIYHLEDGGVWIDVTASVDTVNNTVTGVVSSFSWYAPGQPNFGLEFKDPISALLSISDPMQINSNRTLPVNFVLTDSNGFVSTDDVTVQILDNTNNGFIGEVTAIALKNHYKANLSLKELNLASGIYKLRVKVGNTTYTPVVLFQLI